MFIHQSAYWIFIGTLMKDYKIVIFLLQCTLFPHVMCLRIWYNGRPSLLYLSVRQLLSRLQRNIGKQILPKLRTIKNKEKSPGEVLNSSSVIKKWKQEVKSVTNNFKKMAHNPNSSNADKNYDSDCCKEW